MRVMIIIKGTKNSEAGVMPTEQVLAGGETSVVALCS